jgi:hypothetical protein
MSVYIFYDYLYIYFQHDYQNICIYVKSYQSYHFELHMMMSNLLG